MFLVNTDYIEGKELEMLGLVKGSTVRTRNLGWDFVQGLKSMAGGELGAYTKMLNDARETAAQRMAEEAQALGADAVVSVRFATSSVMQGAAEVMAYGTAVRYRN